MRLAVTTARGYSFGSSRSALPNKRLKLAGPALRGTNVCAPASSYRRAGRLRPPALAPQLKRDPLGVTGALMRLRLLLPCCVLCVLPRCLSAQAVPLIATRGLDLLVKGQPDSA